MFVVFKGSYQNCRTGVEFEEEREFPHNTSYEEIQKEYEEFLILENQGDWFAYVSFNNIIPSEEFKEEGLQLEMNIKSEM
jgi:hypothetical protein